MSLYPNHKGLVNGIVLCGFGISALIFDKVQTALINPSNLEQDTLNGFDDEQIMQSFPFVFVYLGICFFVMQMIGICLLSSNATQQQLEQGDIGQSNEYERASLLLLHQQTPMMKMNIIWLPCSRMLDFGNYILIFSLMD